MRQNRYLRLIIACVLGASLGLAACSDDGDDDATTDEPSTVEESAGDGSTGDDADLPAQADPTGDSAGSPLCAAWIDVEAAVAELEGPDADEDTIFDVAATIRDLLNDAGEPPATVAAPVETLVDRFTAAADGDAEQFDTPGVSEAYDEIGQWVATDCGFPVVDVSYSDFAFDDLPGEVDAGPIVFRATNSGGGKVRWESASGRGSTVSGWVPVGGDLRDQPSG